MTPRDHSLSDLYSADRDYIRAMRCVVARMAEPRNVTARLANYERLAIPSEVVTAWDGEVVALDAELRKRAKRRRAA